jgi:hypothetical protein
VAQLTSALEGWVASVPPHCAFHISCARLSHIILCFVQQLSLVKWEPNQPNPVWRAQSARLHIAYHMLHMHIYQCFITGPGPGGAPPHVDIPLGYAANPCPTALALCAHAARSTARIIQGLLSHVSSPAKAWVELRDIPAMITGACMTGTIIHTVSVAKGRMQHAPTTHVSGRASEPALSSGQTGDGEVGTTLGDTIINDESFCTCVEALKLVQDR